MIKFLNVSSGRNGRRAVNQCSLQVRRGEVLSIVGMTASGKSSVLAVLAGRQRANEGQIILDGQDVTAAPRKLVARCAYAHDTLNGPGELSAREWVRFWLALAGGEDGGSEQRLSNAAKTFQLTPTHEPIERLSRGERRLWDLARIWASPQDVLILDNVLTAP